MSENWNPYKPDDSSDEFDFRPTYREWREQQIEESQELSRLEAIRLEEEREYRKYREEQRLYEDSYLSNNTSCRDTLGCFFWTIIFISATIGYVLLLQHLKEWIFNRFMIETSYLYPYTLFLWFSYCGNVMNHRQRNPYESFFVSILRGLIPSIGFALFMLSPLLIWIIN